MNEINIWNELIKLCKKAIKHNEVPVAAIIVYNNKIIAKCYNKREEKQNIMAHAEILAINKASKKLKNWNLSDCILYVTLKPCKMCEEVIKQSRIKQTFYLLDKPSYKHEFNKTLFTICKQNEFTETYQQLLSSFFKNMR